jgi:hypothetical protein
MTKCPNSYFPFHFFAIHGILYKVGAANFLPLNFLKLPDWSVQ